MKFHINKNGVPAPCRATKRPCPYGGADAHYDSVNEAQAAADVMNATKYGITPENEDFDFIKRKDFENKWRGAAKEYSFDMSRLPRQHTITGFSDREIKIFQDVNRLAHNEFKEMYEEFRANDSLPHTFMKHEQVLQDAIDKYAQRKRDITDEDKDKFIKMHQVIGEDGLIMNNNSDSIQALNTTFISNEGTVYERYSIMSLDQYESSYGVNPREYLKHNKHLPKRFHAEKVAIEDARFIAENGGKMSFNEIVKARGGKLTLTSVNGNEVNIYSVYPYLDSDSEETKTESFGGSPLTMNVRGFGEMTFKESWHNGNLSDDRDFIETMQKENLFSLK